MLCVVISFCPVHCPHCGARLRLVEDEQRRVDFFNGSPAVCRSCGVVFTFLHSSIPAAALQLGTAPADSRGATRD